jgi:hypothetical protein
MTVISVRTASVAGESCRISARGPRAGTTPVPHPSPVPLRGGGACGAGSAGRVLVTSVWGEQ